MQNLNFFSHDKFKEYLTRLKVDYYQNANPFCFFLNDVWYLVYPNKKAAKNAILRQYLSGIDYKTLGDQIVFTPEVFEYCFAKKNDMIERLYRDVFKPLGIWVCVPPHKNIYESLFNWIEENNHRKSVGDEKEE